MLFCINLILVLNNIIIKSANGWNYEDVSVWSIDYPECGLTSQSPIDIITNNDYSCNNSYTLSWTSEILNYAITNNGHSLRGIPFEIDDQGTDITVLQALIHTNDTQIKLINSFFDTYSSSVNQGMSFNCILLFDLCDIFKKKKQLYRILLRFNALSLGKK